MKRTILAVAVLSIVAITGCNNSNDAKQAQETEQIASEAHRKVGMPGITNFQERKFAKQIMELRDSEKLVCYAYTQSMDGKFHFLFKTMGYGLPYGVQMTNPERMAFPGSAGSAVLKQPEPNGLFMPDSAEATWLLAIGPDGKTHPVYCEPRVVVSPFKLPNAVGNPAD